METFGPQRIISVSELTEDIASILEGSFPFVWVEGEVTNVRIPSSGHLYFMLKDERSQIRCVMFKNQIHAMVAMSRLIGTGDAASKEDGNSLFASTPEEVSLPDRSEMPYTVPKDGDHVLICGRVGVYEARGEYQIITERIEPVGIGAMTVALERLKEKLEDKGYFDPARKKALPFLPKKIAIVTSPTGAALVDMLTVIFKRHPKAHVVVVPARVQGEGAAEEIALGISLINEHGLSDVIICGRGGGSIEDLWAFNTEVVADAIFKSQIPVVSAVGHETDVTIADFVADVRALTPTAAAELVVPKIHDLLMTLDLLMEGLISRTKNRVFEKRRDVDALSRRLRIPAGRIEWVKDKLFLYHSSLVSQARQTIMKKRGEIDAILSAMERLNPLGVLDRGYAIVEDMGGRIIIETRDIEVGDTARIRLRNGTLHAKIVKREFDDS